jgi:hypothetical protein
LASRAARAVHALTSLRDEQLDGQVYFFIRYSDDPPRAYHDAFDYGDGTGRHTDALTLAHIMTGSQEALDAAREMGELLIRWQGKKGLNWWPDEPWTKPGAPGLSWWTLREWQPTERVAEIAWSQRGTLMGLTSLYLLTGEDRYRRHAEALVDGLNEIALAGPDYRFFPELAYRQGGWRHTEEPVSDGTSEFAGVDILPLLRLCAVTGYEPALTLAEGLARFILHRAEGYELDGRFYKTTGLWGHFHSKVGTITGIIRLGLLTGQPEYVAWGRQAYEAAKAWGTDFGWFPESLRNHRRCETCGITDMIEIALLLGLHLDPSYLSDAERYGRNHLVESQFAGTAWAARIPQGFRAEQQIYPDTSGRDSERWSSDRDIVARSAGGFAGWSAPNDLFDKGAFQMMQCCNGAGTRALYDLWHYAVSDDGRRARVHLAFSRPAPWGDIVSYRPSDGRVDVTMKAERSLGVRVPEWVSWSDVQVLLNDEATRSGYEDCYLWVEDLKPGDTVSVRYPLPLHSSTAVLGEDVYIADYKGDSVVNITPEGRYVPLYRRDQFLGRNVPETDQLWHLPSSEIDPL